MATATTAIVDHAIPEEVGLPDLWIKQIRLTNIGPFEDFILDAAPVVVISGANRLGKTTLLKTIQALLDDHNPDLIREGCEFGEVYVLFSDGMQVWQKISRSGSDYKILTGDGLKVVKQHKAFLRALATGFALDPLKFITDNKKDREAFLRKVLPIVFTNEELSAVLNEPVRIAGEIDLTAFEAFHAARCSARTEQNRVVGQMEGMVATLRQALPPASSESVDWRLREAALRIQIANLRESARVAEQNAKNEYGLVVGELDKNVSERIEEIRRDAQQRIDAVKVDAAQRKAKLLVLRDAEIAERNQALEPEIESLSAEHAQAQAKADEQMRSQGVREQLKKTERELRTEAVRADQLQKQVDALVTVRQQKLETLPIKGVEFRDGEIFYQGRNFDTQLSSSEQDEVAMKLASLGCGKLPLMVIDGAESLDDVRLNWAIQTALANGFQVFFTKVDPGKPLTITRWAA